MRRANGTGCITKLSGKRRKPWMVRVTVNFKIEDGKAKQNYKCLGYYPTKKEAETALGAYLADPYEIDRKGITFAEVYDRWTDQYFDTLTNQSAVRTIKSAYAYFSPIHNKIFSELRVAHLEGCIKDADVGSATKARMKSLINLMYKWAIKNEITKTDYAHMCDSVKKGKPTIERVPFSAQEIKTLWDNINYPFVDMVIIGIYTGWRPQELATLKTEGIHDGFMQGGLKTDAGKNRVVPIHEAVEPLVSARMKEAEQLHSQYLFNDPEGQQGTHMTYDKYRGRFDKVMKRLGMTHRPHDTRHTFATYAEYPSNMNPILIKMILGHETGDITSIYTHRTLAQLTDEMKKFKIPEKDEIFIKK